MRNPIPAREWDYITPLPPQPCRMLELGNKRNDAGTYKAWFESLGVDHTSVDWNGEDGALKMDLRKPLNLGRFDMVTNIGTTEHVRDQFGVWQNIDDAVVIGGVFVSVTPCPGHWPGHGLYYPTFDFYHAFAELNGFRIQRMEQWSPPSLHQRACFYVRMYRHANPMMFTLPYIERNVKWDLTTNPGPG